jgi:hypothetical protein
VANQAETAAMTSMTNTIATRGTNAGGGGPRNFIANRPTNGGRATRHREQRQMPQDVARPHPQHGAEPEDQRRQGSISDDDHRLIIIAALQDLRLGELDTITARVLEALAREDAADAVDAATLTFLLRQYLGPTARICGRRSAPRSPRRSSTRLGEPTAGGRAAWLMLFAEVTTIAEDERIVAVIGELVASLRAEWPAASGVAEGSASVEAVLRASSLFDPQELVPPAIDQLEHVVGGAYQPGEGVRGGLINQVRAASAL